MSIKDRYVVNSIDKKQTYEWILKKHYAKRIPPIEFSFGLFNDKLCGVICYGTPASSTLRKAIGSKLLELNRVVINSSDKNIASYFISRTLKLLPFTCVIVSYADTSQNHHGYIYQATNWIYTGLSAKRTDWKIKGMEHLHGTTIADKSRGVKLGENNITKRVDWLRQKYGSDFYLEDRPRKHRYFYFIGSKFEKKEMLKRLPYSIEPYPKGENKRYDASYNPTVQTTLF